jgi:hypothetical protein
MHNAFSNKANGRIFRISAPVIPVPPVLFPAKNKIIKTIAKATTRRYFKGRWAFIANSGL